MRVPEIETMWAELGVSLVPTPAAERYLEALRGIYHNGGAHLFAFMLEPPPLFAAHAASDDLARLGFPLRFLQHPKVAPLLPPACWEPDLATVEADFVRLDEALEDELTLLLVRGGAYGQFEGTPDEAEDLAITFCQELLAGSSAELTHYLSYGPWYGWFHNIAWDFTWVGIDRAKNRAWVLVATDTD